MIEFIPSHTPPHQCKAYTNLNVSKALMLLNLALNSVFHLDICFRFPTDRYFIKLGFWAAANPQPTARRGSVKDSIVFRGGRAWR